MSDVTWIILAGALATYLTRIGGHVLLSGRETLPPRLNAALDAVPAAVLTAIVAPSLAFAGPAETITLIVAGVAALYLPPLGMLAVGWATIVALRALIG